MFNSKYSKVLTIILVIAIIAIIGLLIYVAIDWYKAYSTDADVTDGLNQFDGYINNITTNNTTTENDTIIDPDIDENDVVQNTTENTNTKPTYKGFNMVGKIEIPKINIEYPVLEEVTPNSIEVSVAVLYGPGINEVGNTVIIGHNFRNGTFFSNNDRLSTGDEVYLTDLNGTRIKYVIYKKYTTGTDDFDYAVRDTNGKREISLSTCTDDGSERIIIWAREE